MDPAAAQEAFGAALTDARLDVPVLFFPYHREPRRIPKAAFHPPEVPPSVDELIVLDSDEQTRIQADVAHYRVTCWTGLPDPVVVAVLRHELEHVRQYRFAGGETLFHLVGA